MLVFLHLFSVCFKSFGRATTSMTEPSDHDTTLANLQETKEMIAKTRSSGVKTPAVVTRRTEALRQQRRRAPGHTAPSRTVPFADNESAQLRPRPDTRRTQSTVNTLRATRSIVDLIAAPFCTRQKSVRSVGRKHRRDNK